MSPLRERADGRVIGIAAPVAALEEVDGLVEAGATELYCGLNPEAWRSRHGEATWLNRRALGNLATVEQVAAVVERAGKRSVPVKVAMNAPYYTAAQLPEVVELCRALAGAGVGGVVVSDVGLVAALRDAGLGLRVTASSVAGLRNAQACALYADLGVSRVVVPRHVTVEEIAGIRRALPDLELEAFILNDGCVYDEGSCFTTHALGAFCMTPRQYDFRRLDGAELSAGERAAVEQNLADHRSWSWHVSNCGNSMSARGLPNGPCGLCAIHDLATAGLDCLKIVGRESHPFRKLRSVQLVAAVVEEISTGAARDEVARFARDLRATPELCDQGYMCYFREVRTLGREVQPPHGLDSHATPSPA